MAYLLLMLRPLLWNRGVAEPGTPPGGLFIHLILLFGLFLSILFLGEKVRSFHLLGITLLSLGIYLAVVAHTLSRLYKPKES